jgi:hypothetical protein
MAPAGCGDPLRADRLAAGPDPHQGPHDRNLQRNDYRAEYLTTPSTGHTVVVKVEAVTVCTGVTNSSGTVTCTMSLAGTLPAILGGGVTAYFQTRT